MDIQTNQSGTVLISDSAAKRIAYLVEKNNNPDMKLRLTVLGGGCSGFKYSLEFDDQAIEGDITFEKNGAKIVTDDISLQYLNGAEIDFVEDMMSAAFKIRNPNATAGCGCGKSFNV